MTRRRRVRAVVMDVDGGRCHRHGAAGAGCRSRNVHPRHRGHRIGCGLCRSGDIVLQIDEEPVARMHVEGWRLRTSIRYKTEQRITVRVDGSFIGEIYTQNAVFAKQILRLADCTSHREPRAGGGRLSESTNVRN